MKNKAAWFVVAAAVGTAAICFVWRQRALTELRAGNEALGRQLQAQVKVPAADVPIEVPPTNGAGQLSPQEQRELLRLRGQIQPLRNELADLSNHVVGATVGRPGRERFSELSADEAARLEQQRAVVAAVAKERYATPSLTRTKADLPVLQRLLDDRAFAKTQTNELQCLGVAFGDILAAELPLRWVMVANGRGEHPVLRVGPTHRMVRLVNPIPMFSNSVERGEAVDLAMLLEGVRQTVARMERQSQE